MSKRSYLTNVTRLPASVTRESAIALLHDHHGMIELNPLVIRHETTHPPPNASRDEKDRAVWYLITDKVNYLGPVKSEVAYKACFYNLPRGLQTHVFAPGGVEIRSKWSVGGNEPGEAREPVELGRDKRVPAEGLYIIEEVDLRCNIIMSSFIRKNLKKSHLDVGRKIIARAREISGFVDNSIKRPGSGERTASASEQVTAPGKPGMPRSFPLHCTCVGASHDPSCTLFSPEDLARDDGVFNVQKRQPKPWYAISLPSNSSYSQPSSAESSPVADSPYPELYGSPGANSCLCTGALHEEQCEFYGRLRLPQFGSFPSPVSPESIQQPAGSDLRDESQSSPPLRHKPMLSLGNTFVAQRPGEQSELAAARSPVEGDLLHRAYSWE